jgi:hypothetical protein
LRIAKSSFRPTSGLLGSNPKLSGTPMPELRQNRH